MNETKFKVGDKIKVIKCDAIDKDYEGQIGEVIKIIFDGTPKIKFDNGVTQYSEDDVLELVTEKGKARFTKAAKPIPVNFLLKYDLDEDPIEEFETMAQVNERIDYLVQNERSLKRESMVIYTIKKKQRVSVKTKITLHA